MALTFIPVDILFEDWKDSLLECTIIKENGTELKAEGMPNNEDGKDYIMFKYGVDVSQGDVIINEDGNFVVNKIKVNKYGGEPNSVDAFI